MEVFSSHSPPPTLKTVALSLLKAKLDKCHQLIDTDESVTLKFKNETITNSFNQKVLGILFNNRFDFDEHDGSLCTKAW